MKHRQLLPFGSALICGLFLHLTISRVQSGSLDIESALFANIIVIVSITSAMILSFRFHKQVEGKEDEFDTKS